MVLLSFDIEEFDLPLELGQSISHEEQIDISEQGLNRILDILDKHNIAATFYSTAHFMESIHDTTRRRLVDKKHEIASHGYYHSKHNDSDHLKSRLRLEELTGKSVKGFRMPRMQKVSHSKLAQSGYSYDSSLHPTLIPGRYNNLDKPRLPHQDASGLWVLPASVTPLLRIPLFWLSMHILPMWLYMFLVEHTLRQEQYLNIYFHPWEFAELKQSGYHLPRIITRNSGLELVGRLDKLISHLKGKGFIFTTSIDLLDQLRSK